MIGPIMGGFRRSSFDAASYAMTVVGNSISDASVSDLVPQLNALAPISNKFTISNRARNGWSIQQLAGVGSEVDNLYVNGKTNVLLFWELTNNIHNDGRTGAQTIDDAIAYVTARQAYVAANRPGQKPWTVVLMTGLPRGDFLSKFTAQQGEIEMQYCNTYIREKFREMGAAAYVEARRAGGPYNFTDATNGANFPSSLWRDRTHPNSAGNAILAQYIADVLKRLPAR